MARHLGDVMRLALTKYPLVWQVFTRTILGARVVDASAPQDVRLSGVRSAGL
jgi:hypothetical protein